MAMLFAEFKIFSLTFLSLAIIIGFLLSWFLKAGNFATHIFA
jgi:hypothetical protein